MVCITSEITSIDIVLLYRVGHPVETGIGNINFFLKKKKIKLFCTSLCINKVSLGFFFPFQSTIKYA